MQHSITRRDLLRIAVALPSAATFANYHALAAPLLNKVKITGIKAMAIRSIAGNCLIRIETMKSQLIGKDPLTTRMHTYVAHIPTRQRASTSRFGIWPARLRACRWRRFSAAHSGMRSRCTPMASG